MNFAKPAFATAIFLASLVTASAQNREELETGIHGTTRGAVQATRDKQRLPQSDWRAAHAREHNMPGHIHVEAGGFDNPLLDDIHGGRAR